MGKRSDFVRKERDFYVTPSSAVEPLLPHLKPGSTFIEPCAGNGALIEHLQGAGHKCHYACDIEPQVYSIAKRDAFDISHVAADYTITNPPWDRKVLHPMISHFVKFKPTWLLFDADWMHTKQAKPYMPMCKKIVSVGRVKWFPESKMVGKDNCAWYLFEQGDWDTIFVSR